MDGILTIKVIRLSYSFMEMDEISILIKNVSQLSILLESMHSYSIIDDMVRVLDRYNEKMISISMEKLRINMY